MNRSPVETGNRDEYAIHRRGTHEFGDDAAARDAVNLCPLLALRLVSPRR